MARPHACKHFSCVAVFGLVLTIAACVLDQADDESFAKPLTAAELTQIAAARQVLRDGTSLKRIEPAALDASRGRARRVGRLLLVSLESKEAVSFEDTQDTSECDGPEYCRFFSLIVDLPDRHAFVIAQLEWEYIAFHLIDDRTGRGLKVDSLPIFEPNGLRILVIDDGVTGRKIQVWRRQGDRASLEFQRGESEDSGYLETYFVRWEGDRIELVRTDGRDAAERAARRWPAELLRTPEGWRFRFERPPPLPSLETLLQLRRSQ